MWLPSFPEVIRHYATSTSRSVPIVIIWESRYFHLSTIPFARTRWSAEDMRREGWKEQVQ
jgi:hypothetical protein